MLAVALITAVTIVLWATARLPEHLTALIFFAAAMLFGIAPGSVVFSGFASSAFWLVISGYVLGVAIRKTGLASRCSIALEPLMSGSYPRMALGVVLLTYALAFVMPSNMGRIALLMPVVMAFADRAGLEPGGRGRIGLALAVGFGTFQLSASILPANVPNLVMAGAIETAYGIHLSYLPYLLLHAPVLGILKGAVLVAGVCLLFSEAPRRPPERVPLTPMTAGERRLAALLSMTLLLWVTDSIHGISPAWIGLTAACICMLPRIGFVSGEEFEHDLSHRTAFYVAAMLGLAAVVQQSGLGTALGEQILKVAPFDPAAPFRNFLLITATTMTLDFVVTANGVPALFTPLADALAQASGYPLHAVLMIQVIGYSTPLLPYQASPVVVAMGLGRVPLRDGVKLALLIAAVSFSVLVPLDFWWFSYMGYL